MVVEILAQRKREREREYIVLCLESGREEKGSMAVRDGARSKSQGKWSDLLRDPALKRRYEVLSISQNSR